MTQTTQQAKTPQLRFKQADGTEYPDWRSVRLGDLLNYEQPTKYIVSSTQYKDTYKTPVLTAGKSFVLGYTNETNGVYDKGDCIIFDDFTTAIKYVDFTFKVKSSAMKILKNKNSDNNLKVIYESMCLLKYPVSDHKRYWIAEYSELEIKLPCLDEQKQIAKFLSIIDKRIELLQAKYDNLQKYKTGILQKIFTQQIRFKQPNSKNYPDWKTKKLGDVFTFETATSKSKYIEYVGKYLIADMGAVSEQGNLIANKQTNYNKDMLKTSDLIMPKDDIGTGLIIGKVAMIDQENKYICGDHVFKIIYDNLEYSPYFLKSLFNSTINNRKIKKVCQGSPILGLGKENLKSVSVLMPCLDEQKQIADFLSAIDKKITITKTQITATTSFKQGLLQQMFI